jgi:anti-anti-sigma factor
MVRSDTVFQLRDTITEQRGVRAILLDLSELQSISGGGVGMLVFLREWARCRGVQLWLCDPPPAVRKSLTYSKSASEIKVASMSEVVELIDWEGLPGMRVTKSEPRALFEPSAA